VPSLPVTKTKITKKKGKKYERAKDPYRQTYPAEDYNED
jgi:hypothetical protein